MISLVMSELLANQGREDIIVSFGGCIVQHVWDWHITDA
jgi:methylmalonyl-CoA mutase cobalamin-binding subunit